MQKNNPKENIRPSNPSSLFNIFFSQNLAVYEIMWKNMEERDSPQATQLRMHISCCHPRATTHASSNIVTLVAFHGDNGWAIAS
jgi:hypothetical protein